MIQSVGTKVWYVTHGGEQYGPVSIDDLKFEADRGELKPRLDMVWKEGMEGWIPSGEVEGLFEINPESEEAEQLPEGPLVNDFQQEEREGITRKWYIVASYIVPLLVAWGFGSGFFKANLGEQIMQSGPIVLGLLLLVLVIISNLRRFRNLAMSRWWFFGIIVPPLNFWLGYRLFACPAGYAEHKRLGPAGWFLAIFYWLLILAGIGLGVFAAIKGPEAFHTMIDEGLTKIGVDIEEFQKQAPLKPPPSPD